MRFAYVDTSCLVAIAFDEPEQSAEIEQAATGLHVHEKVHVAMFVGLAPSNGPEDPHPSGPVLGGNPEDCFSILS